MRSLVPWLALALAGCASFPRLTRPPLEPPAEGEWIDGAGGARLYTSVSAPDREPVGVVWFVLGPEIGSTPLYPALSSGLHAAGFATAVIHPRGTGYSPGLRGDLDDYRLFLADQRQGLEHLRKRFGAKPIFLMGQSAGAAFALEVAATSPQALAGLVLVNPAYKLRASEGMTPTFGDYLAFIGNMIFRPAALTVDMNSRPSAAKHRADREEAEAMQGDPLVVRYFSMRYLLAQRKVMDRCATNAAAISAPLLLVDGAEDALVDPAGSDELFRAAKSADKIRLRAEEAGHGSSAVETMVSPIVDWLLARVR
jgi:alpha-beta hydrolase superfamily lysophospholipase